MSKAQSAKAARRASDGIVRRSVLPSGLRIVTENIPGNQTFAVGFFVGVGSVHEAATNRGAAHYLEHVLFKGTPTRTAEEISAAFDAIGGDANAYTSREHTCFYARVLADDADLALDVLDDMLTRSLIRQEDVDAERTVILDEIAMHNDEAMEVAYSLVAERIYGARLAREVIGTTTSIAAMSRGQVRAFWRRHYTPSNIVVAAAGRVDHRALVRRFASWDGEPSAHPLPEPGPVASLGRLATRHKEQEQAACVLAFPGPARSDRRRYAADLLSMALGGGMSARLFVEVRERHGLAYHIDASTSSQTHAGQFSVEWLSAPSRVAEILDLVATICADVVAHGITEEELARVQGQIRGQLLLGYDSAEARMMRHGRSELAGERQSLAQILRRYAAVTPAQVRSVAREILAQDPVLAVVGGTVERGALQRRLTQWPTTIQGALG